MRVIIFNQIHKGLRSLLYESSLLLQQTHFSDGRKQYESIVMKKVIIICLVLFSVITTAFFAFDSGKTPSYNNEGLRKPDAVVNAPSDLQVLFK